MGATEKKIAVVLVLVLIAMVVVYVTTGNRPRAASAERPGPAQQRAGQATGAAESCEPTSGGGYAETEELGKAGAKVEIIAVVPVAHGCHNATIAELKKAYEKHPDDIHLTIVDLMGPEGPKYREKVGSPYTRITINGKYQFDVNGRKVLLEKVEGATYKPSDLGPIIEAELK